VQQLWQKVRPGGSLVLVVMSRCCWWETLYFLLKGNPKAAFRRKSREAVHARLSDSATIPTWYFNPVDLNQIIPEQARKTVVFPVGFWLPPSYLDPLFKRMPRLLRLLTFFEQQVTSQWMASASDHFCWVATKYSDNTKP
jgi:hypothetical protein